MSLPDSNLADAGPRGVFVQKPRAGVYTMMLIVSFIAIVIGCLCLHAEMNRYDYDRKASSAQAPAG